MKARSHLISQRRGMTLLEMSLVIMVLMALISVSFLGAGSFKNWKAGKEASETLRNVYVAQRTFFADNPTTPISSVTHAMLLPYLPGKPSTFPRPKSLTGSDLTVFVGASPPYLTTTNTGSGATLPSRYDPSNNTSDSLWDVGE